MKVRVHFCTPPFPFDTRACLLAAALGCASPSVAQVNSTNIAGTGTLLPTANFAAVISGNSSTNGGTNSAIIGAANSIVPGGTRFAFIGAGNFNNMAAGSHSAAMIAGFSNNLASGSARSAMLGGAFNTNAGRSSSILGGELNVIRPLNTYATIGGGVDNLISSNATAATIGGGTNNTAEAFGATVPGGQANQASGTNSFAAGTRAWAAHAYSFVWGGSPDVDTISTNPMSYTARAPGGFRLLSSTNNVAGLVLPANSSTWATLSDSNAKTGFRKVDYRDILAKVAALPVTAWHYKHDPKRLYIGPMAQDFRAAFGLGSDDKTISTLDTDGVTLAAIKGLAEEIEEQDRVLGQREAQIQRLEESVRQVRERMQAAESPSSF